jgi:hypothetical protein
VDTVPGLDNGAARRDDVELERLHSATGTDELRRPNPDRPRTGRSGH